MSFSLTLNTPFAWPLIGEEGKSLCAEGNQELDGDANSDLIACAIRKAQQGDKDSFEWLIKEHLEFLSREIAKICPHDSVEDVAQDVLIRAYQALPRYEDSGAFRWWLKKIAVRASLDYWRSQRRTEKLTSAFAEQAYVSKSDETLLPDLERFLAQLSADDRVVFILVFLDERSHKEVAELLSISLTATKVRCFRLRQKMKSWFTV